MADRGLCTKSNSMKKGLFCLNVSEGIQSIVVGKAQQQPGKAWPQEQDTKRSDFIQTQKAEEEGETDRKTKRETGRERQRQTTGSMVRL